jgi:O-antigen/teichoic acid export membrane protein
VNFIISIISVTIITRVFSPDLYGTLNMFNSASNVLMGVACLGLDSSFLRFYNEPPQGYDAKQLLVKCMGIPIAFLTVLSLLIVPLFYQQISDALFNKVSLVITILLCANALSLVVLNFFATCYRMRGDARNYTIQSVLLQFFSKCFVISAALVEPSTNIVITFNTIGIIILTVVYFLIQKKEVLPKKINWSFTNFTEVLQFAVLSWPIVMIIHLNTFLSQMVINWKLGAYSLGIYASAGIFIGIIGVIQNGFKTYWAAFMYAKYITEQEKIKKVHNYVLLFTIALLGIFIIFQNILYSLLGGNYQESRYFFTLILVYPLFQIIAETTAYGITIAKKIQYSLLINLLSAVINVVGCYVLLSYMGIIGAAVASMISALIYLLLSTIIGQKYYRSICQPVKTFMVIIMILVLSITNCIFVNQYILEMMIILGILFITAVSFKKEISELIIFLKKYKRNPVV